MTILRDLRHFVQAKNIECERHEIREYVVEHAEALARAFDTAPATIVVRLETIEDDERLAERLLAAIKRKEAETREERRILKYERTRAAGDAIGARAQWVGDHVQFDLDALLSTALTRVGDLLVFVTDQFEVAVPMKTLIAIARLRRRDLNGYVDAKGLHIRWATGGFNLHSQEDRDAERVVVAVREAAERAA